MTSPQTTPLLSLLITTALVCLGGCHVFDRASTQAAKPTGEHTCASGTARALDAAGLWVGCDDGAWQWDGKAFVKRLDGRFTAGLEPDKQRAATLLATWDGRVAHIQDGKDPQWVTLPKLTAPEDGVRYNLRPAGLKDAPDSAVVGLYEVDSNRVVAVTAGLGAVVSDDHGKTWKEAVWNQRFDQISGSRPLEIDDLIIAKTGRVAFVVYPEGRAVTYEALAQKLEAGLEDSAEGGSPVVATGFFTDARTEVRAIPLGPSHHLAQAPKEGRSLWLFAQHPSRNEATRFMSIDWGNTYLDTGYYDFRVLQAVGSRKRLTLIGIDDQERPVLYMRGFSGSARFASLDLPGADTEPLSVSIEDNSNPQRALLAQGAKAVAYDLSGVTGDRRLSWYLFPIILGLLLSVVFVGRRYRIERKMMKDIEQTTVRPTLDTQLEAPTTVPAPTEEPPAGDENPSVEG